VVVPAERRHERLVVFLPQIAEALRVVEEVRKRRVRLGCVRFGVRVAGCFVHVFQ
jgi:hypothetical protein